MRENFPLIGKKILRESWENFTDGRIAWPFSFCSNMLMTNFVCKVLRTFSNVEKDALEYALPINTIYPRIELGENFYIFLFFSILGLSRSPWKGLFSFFAAFSNDLCLLVARCSQIFT